MIKKYDGKNMKGLDFILEEKYIDRFWSKVIKTDSCWFWQARPTIYGYGQFWTGKNGMWRVHRLSYILKHGSIPDGLLIDHLCHNQDKNCQDGIRCKHRLCVNPDHLEAVSHRDNLLRGKGFAGINSRLTHCPQGHEYNQENTYFNLRRGFRQCKTCNRGYEIARRERLKNS